MGGDNGDDSGDGDGSDRSNPMLREQDRFLPIANVARIMKKTIPRTGKVRFLAIVTLCPVFNLNSPVFPDCQRCQGMCPGVCLRVH